MKKIILCLVIVVGLFAMTGCGHNKKEQTKIILNDRLEFEINSEVNLSSLISEKNEVEILSEDGIIDTSVLGQKEITIKYRDKDKEKEQIVNITIVDTQKPTIEYKKKLSTTEGTEIDLLKDVKVNDNSKENIKATIEGSYDFNKVGTYNLKYIAIDSSNNKTSEEFTLNVKKKQAKSIKVGSSILYFGKYKMEGDIPTNYNGTIMINSDNTASSTGYIYLNKNFVKKELTGKWTVKAKSIGGLAYGNSPEEVIKVDGIFFEWSDGSKSSFGLSNKYFGDQFHGYRWKSE